MLTIVKYFRGLHLNVEGRLNEFERNDELFLWIKRFLTEFGVIYCQKNNLYFL